MAEATASRGVRLGGRYLLLTVAALLMFLPVYTAVVGSVQPVSRLFDFPGVLIPRSIDLSTYGDAFRIGHLGRYLLNSVVVTTVIVGCQVATSILAAYAFAFLRFPFKRVVFLVFLATLMVPAEVTIVPTTRPSRTSAGSTRTSA